MCMTQINNNNVALFSIICTSLVTVSPHKSIYRSLQQR